MTRIQISCDPMLMNLFEIYVEIDITIGVFKQQLTEFINTQPSNMKLFEKETLLSVINKPLIGSQRQFNYIKFLYKIIHTYNPAETIILSILSIIPEQIQKEVII